ncbi:hypothetical protein FPOAC1_003801 [Fusarium poae]|uniref:hypothetical protein n=1 Tax=Fusarium poae TaxID=36050 RepID=UPI001CEADC0A|nr:hypothetical protein FPOAC1_003801 [Fusarium poae]KAG8677773.1 hypothetical protein FPOAC1_003801 [Fusarium poae]
MTQQIMPSPNRRFEDNGDSDSDYQDDDDVRVGSVYVPETDEVRITFDDIINRARAKTLNVSTQPYREEFLTKYGDILEKKTRDSGQTILHMCAGVPGVNSLPRCLLKWNGSLLNVRDEADKTALHIAISKKNTGFVNVVPKAIQDLDPFLAMTYHHKQNCIHMAIYHNLEAEQTIKLIDEASEGTLSATDQNGLTPLHMAVDYKDASESRLRIVQALLRRGNTALNVHTQEPKGLSVYQYHEFTKKQWLDKVSAGQQLEGKRHNEPGLELQDHRLNRLRDKGSGHADLYNQGVGGHKGSSTGLHPTDFEIIDRPLGMETDQGHIPSGESSRGEDEFRLQRRSTAGHVDQPVEKAMRRPQKEGQRPDYAKKIQQEVMLHYLRTTMNTGNTAQHLTTRDQRKAVRFLYGHNLENINLCFNYSQGPTDISEESFTQSYNHINFSPFLRYVSFRRIKLQRPTPRTRTPRLANMRSQKSNTGRGITDLTVLFSWLRRKNVERILKVIVDDLEDPPHSDKAIEECLTNFHVEILDWRKVDICPETIFTACPNVRQLYLRWSGNRAVLRAWGELDGLARLANLEEVHIVWDNEQALESDDRIKIYLRDFEARLAKAVAPSKDGTSESTNPDANSPNVNDPKVGKKKAKKKSDEKASEEPRIILVSACKADTPGRERLIQQGASANSQNRTNDMNEQSNKWLNCMDSFADEIQNIRPELTKSVQDIKVALIDDGVDPHVESLRGKIHGGESFDTASENGPSPYYTSVRGHGTVMADMICRVCPMAKLFVYKLETHSSLISTTNIRGQEQIAAETAALAVRAAINQKVDIISMSWTVRDTEHNREAINSLRDATKDALNAGILLFCAAADTGAIGETEYPWSYDQNRIFRIGAATADGRAWSRTGDPHNLTFMVPGHRVVSRNPHREGALPDDFQERTGSSVATALAAGLAAVVLYCVRLGASHAEKETSQRGRSTTAVSYQDLERLKIQKNMRRVLCSIGLDDTQQRFIEVWRRFESPAQELKKPGVNSSDRAMDIVATLARDLVSGMPAGG